MKQRTNARIPILLQPILTARYGSFLRRRNDGYASSGELPHRTRQDGFRDERGFGIGSHLIIVPCLPMPAKRPY